MTHLVVCYADFRSIPPGKLKIGRIYPPKGGFWGEFGAVTSQESFPAYIEPMQTPKHPLRTDLKMVDFKSPPLWVVEWAK